MAKTNFTDGNKSLGIPGTKVIASWLNQIFGASGHVHDGVDNDGHAPKINLTNGAEVQGILPASMTEAILKDYIINKTDNYTLTTDDLTGRYEFTNFGASGQVNFIFPAAAANYKTLLKVINAQYVNFVPEVTDSVFMGGTTLSPYTTGTVSTTSGSAVVIGLGTTWTTNAKAGDSFRASGGGLYIIQSVDSDTQITLTANHSGSLSGVTYGIGKSVKCKVPGFEFIVESYAVNKWTIKGVGIQPEIAVKKISTQLNLANDVWTLVTWDTEDIDNNDNFNNNAATPTLPGKHAIKFILAVIQAGVVGSNARAHGALYKNGSFIQGYSDFSTSSSYEDRNLHLSWDDNSNGNDVYTVYCKLISGTGDVLVQNSNGGTISTFKLIRLSD